MSEARTGNRILVIIGVIFALGMPFSHMSTWTKVHSGLGPLWGGEAAWIAFFLAILVYVLVIEKRPLSSIGFRRPKAWDFAIGIGAMIAIVFGDTVISIIEAVLHLAVKPQINAIFATPLWYRVFIAIRAGVVEETAFRGYGLERIVDLTGNKWLAAFVTFALFTAAHYSGGGLALALVAAWGGVVLTAVYLWRQSLDHHHRPLANGYGGPGAHPDARRASLGMRAGRPRSDAIVSTTRLDLYAERAFQSEKDAFR